MGKISTKELFDLYFEEKEPEVAKKIRGQVDRKELYVYEEKIGKQLVDMDVDELFDMILTFNNNREKNNSYAITYGSFYQIASIYRGIFDYYIDNIEVIKNPWHDKRMRGAEAIKRLVSHMEPITMETVEDIIKQLHKEYEETRAKYNECIIRLFLNGFAAAKEIVNISADDIDHRRREVKLQGRTIALDSRCYELLIFVNAIKEFPGQRSVFDAVQWHDKFFKYPVSKRDVDAFQDRSERVVAETINRRLIVDVKKKFNVDINYRMLYLLGFYNYLVENIGEEETKKIILSVRDKDGIETLSVWAKRYGIVIDNITHLKKYLRPFVTE